MNKVFTVTCTQPEDVINEFARAVGYQEQVYRMVDVTTTVNGVTTTTQQNQLVDNEQTPVEFVRDYFYKILTETMIRPSQERIFREAQISAQEQVQELKAQVEQTISIEVEDEGV